MVLVSWGALAQAEDLGLYLFQIPITRATAATGVLAETVQADLHVPNPAYLVTRLSETSLSVIAVEENAVRLAIGSHDTFTGAPTPQHRTSTFVIDYDEVPVAKLVNKIGTVHGSEPSIEELLEFVDVAIANKSFRRHFDLASQVAVSGEGDCTEHAVLLTALARATNRPARVVLGLMLVETSDNLMALGHAWTEIHNGDAWKIADATRPDVQLPGAKLRYVPLVVLDNEGPGYALQVANFTSVYPVRVDQVRSVEPGASTQLEQ